ncbi:hypothetical protein LOD99_1296 [Oopsacas minuta]|uniref:Uncharacterized protein n=1 Tax=Oopsacas minuta TaxID=111878 RepID=A0AAV7K758_9METZ|nr:hypothetical protein LOD99_1296 [Oopsacas minuta]
MMMDPMYIQPQQDSLRFLHNITQNLISQVTYAKSCRQLIHWCSTLTVYQPHFETALLSCLSAAATCATKPGFDIDLAVQLFQSCCNFKTQASPQFNERLKTLWDDMNEQVAMKRSGNQEQAQRIAQQIQIQAAQQAMPSGENIPHVNQHMNQQHYQPSREIPEYPSLGSSETTVSVVTTIYSSMTSHSVSPSHHAPTTVSIPSSSQPSITTSSPTAIPTPAVTQPTNTKTPVQTQPNTTPVATVQTAAIFAAAHATATATATAITASKLPSGPPGSPNSDTASNKPPPQNLPRPQTAPVHMAQQLERRMSTPVTPMNPLMAALSGPVQFPDSPHQLSQHMMTPLNDPMTHGLPLDGLPLHPQPPPPYNHITTQRGLQLPPTYQDVTTLLPAVSPMQTAYATPNKIPQGVMTMMGPEYNQYVDQFSASYPPQQVSFNKGLPPELGSPYEYPPMMARPNSLYLPPSSYDSIAGNPKSLTETRSYMTPGMGFDVMVPGPGMHSPYINSFPQQGRMGYMQMPATASPTKLTQPMQFPQHIAPAPNHSMMTPNYMMNPKVYPQSAPPGFHIPPDFPQLNKEYLEINKHGDQVIRLTAPIVDGVLLAPFQLQHNNNSISHKFIMKENVFPTLISRYDL